MLTRDCASALWSDPVKHRALSLAQVEKYVPLARERGVSEVARSSRGFVTALRKAGSVSALPEKWQRKRDAFIKRHMAQVHAHHEPLNEPDGTPTRRHLALIMWAYSPLKKPLNAQKNPEEAPMQNPTTTTESLWDKLKRRCRGAVRNPFKESEVAAFETFCLLAYESLLPEFRSEMMARLTRDQVRLVWHENEFSIKFGSWAKERFEAPTLRDFLADESDKVGGPGWFYDTAERAWKFDINRAEPETLDWRPDYLLPEDLIENPTTTKNPTNLLTREYDAVAEIMQDLDAIYRPARTPKARRVARVNVEEFVGHCLEALNALPVEARKYVTANYISARPHRRGGPRERGDSMMLRLQDGVITASEIPTPMMGAAWQSQHFQATIQDLQNLDPMLADEVSIIATPTNMLGDPERVWTYQVHGREPLSRFIFEIFSPYTENVVEVAPARGRR